MNRTIARGAAWICDQDGVIEEILCDHISLFSAVSVGQPVASLFSPDALSGVLALLGAAHQSNPTLDWQLTANLPGGARPLHIAGLAMAGRLLFLAGENASELNSVLGELINHEESVNALRATLREHALFEQQENVLHKLSMLNNEMVMMQRELAKKNAELERINQDKNRLLGLAAHDLRNPLGIILGFSDALIEHVDGRLEPGELRWLEAIQHLSEFMLGVVDNLVDISAIESGKLNLRVKRVDLLSLVSSVVELNRILAQDKSIPLVFAPPANPIFIRVDPGKIEQVLHNLLSNAIKYSHGGSMTTVTLETSGDRARISVQDQGQGIPADELATLFQPFGKTSVKPTAGERASGLGLAIVKRIVEGHGGAIHVTSEVGRGSTFTVELPLDAGP